MENVLKRSPQQQVLNSDSIFVLVVRLFALVVLGLVSGQSRFEHHLHDAVPSIKELTPLDGLVLWLNLPSQLLQKVHEEGTVEILGQLVEDEPVTTGTLVHVGTDVVRLFVSFEVPENKLWL